MKVRDLIEVLQALNPDQEIYTAHHKHDYCGLVEAQSPCVEENFLLPRELSKDLLTDNEEDSEDASDDGLAKRVYTINF